MNIEQKIDRYDLHYQFRSNPHHFDWSCHPERIIVRNEALRTQDIDLYERYLQTMFPTKVETELIAFDKVAEHLTQISGESARTVFADNDVAIVRSDIHWEDEDAIFTARMIPDLDLSLLTDELDNDQLIFNHVYPSWVTNRDLLWIDLSELS